VILAASRSRGGIADNPNAITKARKYESTKKEESEEFWRINTAFHFVFSYFRAFVILFVASIPLRHEDSCRESMM
jgi:hypothetical protein